MKARGHFSGKFGFIAAAAGSAVGLGNIWKFPFEVGQGGGAAFLIVYLIFCFVLCFPIMITEIAIGRKAQRSAAVAFNRIQYPRWSFVGKLGVFCGILILSFYNVVAGWVLGYFFEMVAGNFDIGNEFDTFINDITSVFGYTLAFILATAFIVSKGVTRGIEKASKLLMPILIIIMLFLVGYAFTLPNAMEGVQFYLVPDFTKLNLATIYKALGQSFFSLSLGLGAMITYGSYLGKKEDIILSGTLITIADVGIAFLAGLMIFPFVFSQGLNTDGGAGLIFITMPGVFESMGPTAGITIGSIFFLLLSFAALTSTISLMELPVAYFVDEHNVKRSNAVWLSAGLIFLLGVPSVLANGYSDTLTNFINYVGSVGKVSFMTFAEDLASDTLLPLGGFLTSVFGIYIWKRKNLFQELNEGNEKFYGSWISKYVAFSLQYICPVILGIVFLITVLETFFGIKLMG